jgi:hypothetical protein
MRLLEVYENEIFVFVIFYVLKVVLSQVTPEDYEKDMWVFEVCRASTRAFEVKDEVIDMVTLV